MKKLKSMISKTLVMVILLTMFIPNYSFAGPPKLVEEGLCWVLMAVNNWAVGILNEYEISIDSMIRQRSPTGGDPDFSDASKAYNITIVSADAANTKVKALFSDIIHNLYPALLKIAVIVFLIGLIYIGLLTITSVSASKREEYMQRLTTWATGLLVLFAFSIIMVFLIRVNNTLANVFLSIGGELRYQPGAQNAADGTGDAPEESELMTTVTSVRGINGINYTVSMDGLTGVKADALTLINKVRSLGGGGLTDKKLEFKVKSPSGKEGTVTVEQDDDMEWWAEIENTAQMDGNEIEVEVDGTIDDWEIRNLTDFEKKRVGKIAWDDNTYQVKVETSTGTYEYQVYLKTVLGKVVKYTDGSGFAEIFEPVDYGDIYGVSEQNGWSDGDAVTDTAKMKRHLMLNPDGKAQKDYLEAEGDYASIGTWPAYDAILQDLFDQYANNEGSLPYALLYTVGILMTFMFFVTYTMRTLTIAFLIVIFPVVMAIYCLDKINDNKSGAFQKWLKEYISQVFTNSVHALSYAFVIAIILNQDTHPLIKIIAIWFVLPSGKILKGVFDVQGKMDSDTQGIAGLAAGMALANKGSESVGKFAKGGGGSGGSGGGGSGGSGGFGGGSGGSGGGGFLSNALSNRIGKMSPGKQMAANITKRAGGGLLSLAGAGLTAAAVGAGAAVGAAKNIAAGDDLGKVVEGAAIGGAAGGALAKGGIGLGKKTISGVQRAGSFAGDAWTAGKTLRNEKKIKNELKRIGSSGVGGSGGSGGSGGGSGGNPKVLLKATKDANGNGVLGVHERTKFDVNNMQAFNDWKAQDASRKDYQLDADGHVRKFADNNPETGPKALGDYVYNEQATMNLPGNYAGDLGEMEGLEIEAGVNRNGEFIDMSLRRDSKAVDSIVNEKLKTENQYSQERVGNFIKDFNIDSSVLASGKGLDDKFVLQNVHNQINDKYGLKNPTSDPTKTESYHDKDKFDQAMNAAKQISDYQRNLVKKRNDMTDNVMKNRENAYQTMLNRPELRQFMNLKSVPN